MIDKGAIEKFGSYSAHFEYVCGKAIDDLKKIEDAFQ